jgi:hypothetical protein
VPPNSSGVLTTSTKQTSVGLEVGASVGGTLGEVVGDSVGTTVGLGVVGDGVLVVGRSVGEVVGPCVGTHSSNGAKRRLISSYKVGVSAEAKSFHMYVPNGGT